MAFLRLLPVEIQMKAELVVAKGKIDFDPVRLGHAEPKLLCIFADLVVVNRQATAENDLIQAVQSGATETILFRKGRQWCSRRISRDAEDQFVIRVDVLFKTQLRTVHCNRQVRQVQITAAGDLVSEYFATGQA